MKNKGQVSDNRRLLVILLILMGLIIALVVAIVMVKQNEEQQAVEEENQEQTTIENDATGKCNEINDLYSNGEIPYDIAEQYLINAAESENVSYKTSLIICRAKFVYENGGGIEPATKVLDELEPYFDDEIVKINYYATMRDFYDDNGDSGKARYYSEILSEISNVKEESGNANEDAS